MNLFKRGKRLFIKEIEGAQPVEAHKSAGSKVSLKIEKMTTE